MKSTRFLQLQIVVAIFYIFTWAGRAFDHEHVSLTRLLQAHVKDGRVDYAALKSNQASLVAYLDELAAVPASEFSGWTKNQQLACLINLYNAATLKLIADHFPVTSIKKIGGVFSTPWKLEVVRWGGSQISLDHVEHSLIRPVFSEPRCHFALVCAAKSCPPLRNEAYSGARLNEQLTEQGRTFIAQSDKNRLDPERRILWISEIFKWFEDDFAAGDGSVRAMVQSLLPPESARLLSQGEWKVRYTPYDWSLNGR